MPSLCPGGVSPVFVRMPLEGIGSGSTPVAGNGGRELWEITGMAGGDRSDPYINVGMLIHIQAGGWARPYRAGVCKSVFLLCRQGEERESAVWLLSDDEHYYPGRKFSGREQRKSGGKIAYVTNFV